MGQATFSPEDFEDLAEDEDEAALLSPEEAEDDDFSPLPDLSALPDLSLPPEEDDDESAEDPAVAAAAAGSEAEEPFRLSVR
jgi:hypothetical protein